tara:strand:+ start:16341 stop:16649 length:309 start_codon:yes stop_codon:yes gene_type:complete
VADEELLGRIPRDAKNEFKVTRGRYWNTDYVDIRLHTNGNHTKKGIRLNLDELLVLKQILEKIQLGDEEDGKIEQGTEIKPDGQINEERDTKQGSSLFANRG